MKAQEFMADHIEKMGQAMAHFLETTRRETRTWRQEVGNGQTTRTPYEVVAECIQANTYFASLLRGEDRERPEEVNLTELEDAKTRIIDSANVLARAVRNFPDDGFEKEFQHRVRGPIKGKMLMMGAYRNMAYHSGQINFVQSLDGDLVFHMPPTWLN